VVLDPLFPAPQFHDHLPAHARQPRFRIRPIGSMASIARITQSTTGPSPGGRRGGLTSWAGGLAAQAASRSPDPRARSRTTLGPRSTRGLRAGATHRSRDQPDLRRGEGRCGSCKRLPLLGWRLVAPNRRTRLPEERPARASRVAPIGSRGPLGGAVLQLLSALSARCKSDYSRFPPRPGRGRGRGVHRGGWARSPLGDGAGPPARHGAIAIRTGVLLSLFPGSVVLSVT
jgi:hypothetical protein